MIFLTSQSPTGELCMAGLSTDPRPAARNGDTLLEIDTGKLWKANGTSWACPGDSTYAITSQKGVANGYAGLDGAGLVPVTQLPGLPAAWGAITGTLSAQTDLQSALNGKQASGSYATGSGTASGTNTGDQTITLTGDVTGSGTGSFAATIGAGRVTDAMLLETSAATSATTGTMTVNMTSDIVTITPTGACTFNASGGRVGRIVTFIITTSGTSSFVLTWGTNYRKIGTLATGTVSARFFAVTFRCLSGNVIWQEIARTAVQT